MGKRRAVRNENDVAVGASNHRSLAVTPVASKNAESGRPQKSSDCA